MCAPQDFIIHVFHEGISWMICYALFKCQGRALKGARKSQSILDHQHNYTKSYVSREKIKKF
jgi:hypothetical protein